MKDLKSVKKDFKSLFKDSRDALFIASRQGEIIDVNQAGLDMFGVKRKEAIGKNVQEFYYKVEKPDLLWQELQEKGSVKDFEKALKRPDGSLVYCLISAKVRKDKNGEIIGVQGIIHDITARKNIEEMLKKERNFISAILETTGALVVLLDLNGRFVRINKSFETLTGYNIIDLVGKTIWNKLLNPEDSKGFNTVFEKIISGEFPLEYQCTLVTRDGNQRTVVWSMTALDGQEKNIEYIVASGIDITELQNALSKVNILSGLIPICAHCKKIRDDDGYWNQLESYIKKHSEADFSHGICPDCIRKLYPDYADKKKK